MKKHLLYLIACCLVGILFSCEENNDGFYDKIPRIYFPEETDSLHFSFGDKVQEHCRETIRVPVRMMGLKAVEEMKFKVVCNQKESTAQEGVHFANLQAEYPLLKDSVNAYIPVELIRDKLSEEDVVYQIVLNLEENATFQLGSKENLRAVVTFSNYLEEPEWWVPVFGSQTNGTYHPGMYQRLIAHFGGVQEPDFWMNNYLKVMQAFKVEVYDYAQAHPEETADWEFAEDLWWPFE